MVKRCARFLSGVAVVGVLCAGLAQAKALSSYSSPIEPYHPKLTPHSIKPASKFTWHKLHDFDAVKVIGPFDVTVVHDKGHRDFKVDAKALEPKEIFFIRQHGRTVYLFTNFAVRRGSNSAPKSSLRKNLKLVIRTPDLGSFTYQGSGHVHLNKLPYRHGISLDIDSPMRAKIDGKHLPLRKLRTRGKTVVNLPSVKTERLALDVGGHSHVDLNGKIQLRELRYSDWGWVRILQWVQTPFLEVSGRGHAEATIAGMANDVVATLRDQAYLNARYLRTQRAHVETDHQSRADVSPVKLMNAAAAGTSDIYLFNKPETVLRYLRDAGTVLTLNRPWKAPRCLKKPKVARG